MDALTARPLCPTPLDLQLSEIHFAAPELIVTATARSILPATRVCAGDDGSDGVGDRSKST
jgi:hypothetical protein